MLARRQGNYGLIETERARNVERVGTLVVDAPGKRNLNTLQSLRRTRA